MRNDGQSANTSGTFAEYNGTKTEQISLDSKGLHAESTEITGNRDNYRANDSQRNNLQSIINYRLNSQNFEYNTGAKTRFKNNIAAIRLMYELEKSQRYATEDEKNILARYVGFGGLAQAFDSENAQWDKEYKELIGLLSANEYRSAKDSVLNAHYTNKIVIDGVFAGLSRLGFTQGKILEPAMGIGNFIGLLPETFKASETYGVEIDSISGRIAKLLYPETHIEVKGFEETNYANNSFDAIITNVPFGSYKVYDRHYDNLGFNIHNYFIAKGLDKVRSGGIVAVITSKGTMDKESEGVRQYIADRAELLGAIRLPNTAFLASANTKVTSDILFLKKRERTIHSTDSWIHTSDYSINSKPNGVSSDSFIEDIQVNSYFADNPKMMLGTMAKQMTMYGNENETTLLPDERNLDEAVMQAIQFLPQNVYDAKKAIKSGEKVAKAVLPADENIKNYCYEIIDGKVYQW